MAVTDAHYARQFTNLVEQVTGTRPPIAAGIVAVMDAVDAVPYDAADQPSIARQAADGTLTVKNAATLIVDAAQPKPTIGEAKAEAHTGLLRQWRTAFANGGPAADEVTALLVDAFAEHWAAMHDARNLGIDSSTTADRVVDGGTPATLAAWQGLPAHKQALDQILRIVRELVDFGTIPIGNPLHYNNVPRKASIAAFYLDADVRTYFDTITRVLATGSQWHTERGGLWLRLTTIPGVTFNTADTAAQIMRDDIAARTKAAADEYAATHT